jgi:beta-mannosidase
MIMKSLIVFLILFSFFMTVTGSVFARNEENIQRLFWEVGFHKDKERQPDEWYPAAVPGAVQLDYAKAKKWGPYWYADNWKDYDWMEDVYWTYKASFDKPELKAGEKIGFFSKGIDYEFDIYLNGDHLYYQEGMFTPVDLDITERIKDKNELIITIYPAPKVHNNSRDRSQADRSVKPAVSYGWDWHPRLIPAGIWDETGLRIHGSRSLKNWEISYALNAMLTEAEVTLSLEGPALAGLNYEIAVSNQVGSEVIKETGTLTDNRQAITFVVPDVSLWWPWDQGEPYLYEIDLTLTETGKVIDKLHKRIGFRKVELVMNPGTWQVDGFPKSRSNPPMTMEINGRQIFCRGTNWVNPEIFPGIINRETYDTLTSLALEANFNLLRMWGGAIVNKDEFFELCDEKGIMVWQDFPLACNPYEGTPEYLAVLEQEAVSIIQRLKEYPSLVLWCGGNELFNSWSGMTDQSLALRLLNSLTYQLDPGRPFIPTSPVMGVGHGNYVFRNMATGEEVFQWMPAARNTAYTEFGMPGPSSAEILRSFIPADQLFPAAPGTVWETHHAYKAWVGNTWLCEDMLETYFGKATDLETLVSRGQLVQSQGYKVIYEEARRQKPYCSMALNWCFNEPWPTAANNSIIMWPSTPKPAFDAVSESCRPALASGRVMKFSWREGEEFTVDLFLLNDSPAAIPGGRISVKLIGDSEVQMLNWDFPEVPANQNLQGPTARISLPAWQGEMFDLFLEIENDPDMNSTYTFLYRPATGRKKTGTPALND